MNRRLLKTALLCPILFTPAIRGAEVPRHEIALTLGGLISQQRASGTNRFDLGSGTALQANYGYRLWGNDWAAIYGEVHLLASPQRQVSSANTTLTRDVASLFVTPGIRVKFVPKRKIAPYVAAGGGWSLFEQSTTTLAGQPNPASRTNSHGVFDYGGGVDIRFWRFVGLRGEVRDLYSGNPSYNLPLASGQHNVVVGGGIVLKFGE